MPHFNFRVIVIVTSLVMCLCDHAEAQDTEYDYYFNNGSTAFESEWGPLTSEEYFYVPLEGSGGIFADMSAFGFSGVRYRRRGYADGLSGTHISGIDLSGGLTSSMDYRFPATLRRGQVRLSRSPGRFSARNQYWLTGTGESYTPSDAPREHGASLHATDRTGRAGFRIHSGERITETLAFSAMLYRRWGRDATLDGVFNDETSYFAQFDYDLGKRHSLRLIGTGFFSENGLRSAATREAFELTGDNYYNPSWGRQDGGMRSVRVDKRARNMFLLGYSGEIGAKTTVEVTTAYRFGKRSISALGWMNAMNPYPDYYRNMPSWSGSPGAQEIIREAWTGGDPSVRQVDWDELYRRNATTPDDTNYWQEWRVEDISDLQAVVSGTTRLDHRTVIGYGANIRRENTRRYKQMKDRLGSEPTTDVDPYMSGGAAANNIRTPGRLIWNGDRFGYDYDIKGREYSVWAQASHNAGRYAVTGGAEIGTASLQRNGHYEKAAYPGAMSYGKSAKMEFDTYELKAAFRYSFSPRHIVILSGAVSAQAPWYGSVFISPDYVNLTVADPTERKIMHAGLDYNITLDRFRVMATVYITSTSDETAVYRYYDDIASRYSDMTLAGIDKRYFGVEFGADYDFTSRLTLRVAAAAARNEYRSNPSVTILDDATMTPYVTGSRSYLKGYRSGGSPETVVTAELRYRNRGWTFAVSASQMAGRYVEPTPLRRMERAYNLTGARDLFDSFVSQENLGDATTVGLFVMKSFTVSGRHRLSVLLSVDNLLNDEDIIYSGYELMRVGRRGSSPNTNFMPFDSKYTYARGRTWYGSVTYRF